MATARGAGERSPEAAGRGRAVALGAAVGLAVGAATVGVVYAIIAIPLYALARATEPGEGVDRPFLRDGVLQVALPAGILLGLLAAVVVGVWYARGGRLPRE